MKINALVRPNNIGDVLLIQYFQGCRLSNARTTAYNGLKISELKQIYDAFELVPHNWSPLLTIPGKLEFLVSIHVLLLGLGSPIYLKSRECHLVYKFRHL